MILSPLITIGFIGFAIQSTLFWVGLWQTKEYRLDRFLVHLKETRQGRGVLLNNVTLEILILFFCYGLSVVSDLFSLLFPYLLLAFFIVQLSIFLQAVRNHRVKRPQFTAKSDAIILLTLVSIGLLIFFPLSGPFFWFLFLCVLIPGLVMLFVFLFSFPTEIYTDIKKQQARRKLEKLKKLTVIAVSGSYGKSSTKEAIAHVLSQKYNVVKTKLSNNTPLAIANTILHEINSSTQFFIVEMGAYKKGEIAELCEMVKPDISVTTSVSDQHLSLYGGINDVIDSEMELITEIPKKGLSLFNGNSPLTQKLAAQTNHKKIFYQTSQKIERNNKGITAFAIHPTKQGVTFSFSYKDKLLQLSSPLLGLHTIENILPAVFLGLYFTLTDTQITHAIKTLQPLPKTMVKKTLKNGVLVIDDTFNASPESVSSAADFLSLFKTKRFFVLTPLIELGSMSRKRHLEIGGKLAHFDYIFLTNKNYVQEIENGVQKVNGKARVFALSVPEIAEQITLSARKGDAIVFEGKEAGLVLKHLS